VSDQQTQLTGPDLSKGIPADSLAEGAALAGHAFGEAVLLVRAGDEFFAVGATCTHYGAPLVEGIVVGETVRCPWHHACFSLRTGEALRAPALDPIACWRVEQEGDRIFVREKVPPAPTAAASISARQLPSSIVIVGGGAAGVAVASPPIIFARHILPACPKSKPTAVSSALSKGEGAEQRPRTSVMLTANRRRGRR
jgi:nitrite reductase/ring-hydroxylating ferredoxin subunit